MYCVMEDGLRISLCDFARANICAAIGELVSPNGHPRVWRIIFSATRLTIEPPCLLARCIRLAQKSLPALCVANKHVLREALL